MKLKALIAGAIVLTATPTFAAPQWVETDCWRYANRILPAPTAREREAYFANCIADWTAGTPPPQGRKNYNRNRYSLAVFGRASARRTGFISQRRATLQLHRLGPSFLTSTGRRTDGLMGCRGAQKRQGEIGADEGAERREEHMGPVVRVFDHCGGGKQIPDAAPGGGGEAAAFRHRVGEHHIDRVRGGSRQDHGERDQGVDLKKRHV
jgi:hypothetical protein